MPTVLRIVGGRVHLIIPAVLIASSVAAAPAWAGSRLDPAFGRGGITSFPRYSTDAALAVVLQPNGKIVGAGYTDEDGGRSLAVMRMLRNGEPDPTFGERGYAKLAVAPYDLQGEAVGVQADGKIVVAGGAWRDTGEDGMVVARFRRNGSVDTAFGMDGSVIVTTPGVADWAHDLALAPDGSILLGGQSGGDTALVRLLPDGSFDPTFGVDGMATWRFGSYADDINEIELSGDGHIVATGSTALAPGNTAAALMRFDADGLPDPTFGTGGIVVTPLGRHYAGGRALARDAAGRWVVAGSSFHRTWQVALLRYLPDGTPDPSLGGDGVVVERTGSDAAFPDGVAIDRAGRIVVSGQVNPLEGRRSFVGRYRPSGRPDASFGARGMQVLDFGFGYSGFVGVSIAPGRSIVAAGMGPNDAVIARFLAGPASRPDTMVRPALGDRFTGRGIFEPTGDDQTLHVRMPAGSRSTVVLRVENAGAEIDRAFIDGCGSSAGRYLHVRYRHDGVDVTKAVRDGSYSTHALLQHAAARLHMRLHAGVRAVSGWKLVCALVAVSPTSVTDAARVVIAVR